MHLTGWVDSETDRVQYGTEATCSLMMDKGCSANSSIWKVFLPYSTPASVVSKTKHGVTSLNQAWSDLFGLACVADLTVQKLKGTGFVSPGKLLIFFVWVHDDNPS